MTLPVRLPVTSVISAVVLVAPLSAMNCKSAVTKLLVPVVELVNTCPSLADTPKSGSA